MEGGGPRRFNLRAESSCFGALHLLLTRLFSPLDENRLLLSSSVSFLFTQHTNVKTEKDFYLKNNKKKRKKGEKKWTENEIVFLKKFLWRNMRGVLGQPRGIWRWSVGPKKQASSSILMQRQQTECDLRLAKFQCKSRGARGMGLGWEERTLLLFHASKSCRSA